MIIRIMARSTALRGGAARRWRLTRLALRCRQAIDAELSSLAGAPEAGRGTGRLYVSASRMLKTVREA